MNIVIDIGSFKTVIALFDNKNHIVEKVHFKTNNNYAKFLIDLENNVVRFLTIFDINSGIISISGLIDLSSSYLIKAFDINWHNINLITDIEKITKTPFLLENTSYLSTIFETSKLNHTPESILYISISNNINYCFLNTNHTNEKIISSGNDIMIQKKSSFSNWHSLISGKSIIENYHIPVKEIEDANFWKIYSRDLAAGIWQLNVTYQPEIIIIGGIVGKYFEKYSQYMMNEISNFTLPVIKPPTIIPAIKPLSSSLYGGIKYLTENGLMSK